MEASAIGRPIVTSDVPGCRDAIKQEETGLLVPPKDAKSLKIAISRLLNDKSTCMAMGKNARMMAENEFDVESVVAEHMKIYECLLNS